MKAFSSGFERLLLIVGLLLLLFYLAARMHSVVSSRAELSRFWQAQETVRKASLGETASTALNDGASPDFQLWSSQRITAYKESLASAAKPPLAVLRIPTIKLEVPVLDGTDEFTLNRAVGHIDGTPAPGQHGNIGIAGHRDGFFRGLKDVHEGDTIELVTQKEIARYVVDEILVVSPDDVSVLHSRPKTSLTLVTCYPFYYIGGAPQRYIVHASIASSVDRTGAQEQPASALRGGGQEKH